MRTRDYDPLEGDSNYDLVLSDWRNVGGVLHPHRQVYQLNGRNVVETTVDEVSVNPALAADAFTIPEAYRAGAPKMVAADKVPYQWVLRRPFIGTLLDSDSVLYDPKVSGGLRLVDVAPGVAHVQGGSHNSLIVEMDNFLVVFENSHADGYLMGYVGDVKLGFITDLWSPERDPLPPRLNPALASVVNGVKRWDLAPERFAGGHGSTGSFAELLKVPAN